MSLRIDWESEDPFAAYCELAEQWAGGAERVLRLVDGRREPACEGERFDLICSNRSTGVETAASIAEIARLLEPGGVLVGLAAGETHRMETQEIFGRGAWWPPVEPARFSLPRDLEASGLQLTSFAQYYGECRFPDIDSFTADLRQTGVLPDFDPVKDAALVREIARKLSSAGGIRDTAHAVVFVAVKNRGA